MMALPPIRIEIGPGELVDRLSILRLKAARASGSEASALGAARDRLAAARSGLALAARPEETELAGINALLWEAEDSIRRLESAGNFGPDFVAAARRIVSLNDRRSALKAAIDRAAGNALPTEIKIYDG